MNKFQQIFNFDERIVERKKQKEALVTIFYCLFDPTQWKYLKKWIKSNRRDASPYKDEVAWITYGALDFLNSRITDDYRIFEYGSGGSTLFYSKRAQSVVSVEHDKPWYDLLKKELKRRKIDNCDYRFVKSHESKNSLHEYFSSWREQGVSFRDYVLTINDFEDNFFDLVSVDGRSRVACVRQAYAKVKPGGMVLLDNSDRRDYFGASLFMRDKGCEEINFHGLVGYETPLSQTTIWIKPKSS